MDPYCMLNLIWSQCSTFSLFEFWLFKWSELFDTVSGTVLRVVLALIRLPLPFLNIIQLELSLPPFLRLISEMKYTPIVVYTPKHSRAKLKKYSPLVLERKEPLAERKEIEVDMQETSRATPFISIFSTTTEKTLFWTSEENLINTTTRPFKYQIFH